MENGSAWLMKSGCEAFPRAPWTSAGPQPEQHSPPQIDCETASLGRASSPPSGTGAECWCDACCARTVYRWMQKTERRGEERKEEERTEKEKKSESQLFCSLRSGRLSRHSLPHHLTQQTTKSTGPVGRDAQEPSPRGLVSLALVQSHALQMHESATLRGLALSIQRVSFCAPLSLACFSTTRTQRERARSKL